MTDRMRLTTTEVTQGFKYYVEAEDPDILILTETKVRIDNIIITSARRDSLRSQVNDEPVDPALSNRFPYRYWSISEKKTYCMLSSNAHLSSSPSFPTSRNCYSVEI